MAPIDSKDDGNTDEGMVVSRKVQLLEVTVFLFLIVPSLVLSLFLTNPESAGFRLTAVMVIARDLALVSLVLYFVWRNGETWAQVGWIYRRWPLEILIGVLLYIPLLYGITWLDQFFTDMGLSGPTVHSSNFLHANSRAELWLAVVLVITVAITEETIFRGYLMRRFIGIGLGETGAVILSSLIFSVGHGYEGPAGVATVAVMGAVFALVYLWRGSLVAPIVLHFLQDFLAIVVLPFFVAH